MDCSWSHNKCDIANYRIDGQSIKQVKCIILWLLNEPPLPLLHRFFIKSRLKHYWVYLIRHPLIVTFFGLYASIFSKSLVICCLNSMIKCHRYYLLSYCNGFHSNYIVKSQEKQFLTLKNFFNFHFCERGHCGSYKTYICY